VKPAGLAPVNVQTYSNELAGLKKNEPAVMAAREVFRNSGTSFCNTLFSAKLHEVR
jgi:hypothetical protein